MGVLKFKNENGDWEAVEIPGALKYIEQTLTDEQKAQSRENIGAAREPLIVTGNFPTGGMNTSDGEFTNSLTLSHTLAEICAAYENGKEVRIKLTSSDSYTTFGPWNLKFAELSVFYVQSNYPAAGYYTMNAAGMGFGQYTTTSTPLRLAANMSASTIQLFAPSQNTLEVIENGTY